MEFLKTPVDFAQLSKNSRLARCSMEESIAQNLMLIITSRYGEVAGRSDYGSEIWELEFNQLVRIHKWEEEVQHSLEVAIAKYEKRLKDIEIEVLLSEANVEYSIRKKTHIRRKASINILAKIEGSNVPFHFNTVIYISPLAQ